MPTAIATPNITATGIELFRAGTQTDSKGRSKDWTIADLDEIAAAYNSVVNSIHDAPILDQPAAPIQVGHDSEKAYGWLARVYREGDKLKGDYAYVDPSFAAMVNNKAYRKRSISLYPPDHSANPTPGQWNVRHVAYVAIPAVKGMADHAIDHGVAVQFEDDGEEAWDFEEFGCGYSTAMAFDAIAAMFQSIRDQAIAKDGVEKIAILYPQPAINSIRRLAEKELIGREEFEAMAASVHQMLQNIQVQINPQEAMGMGYYTEATDFMDWKGAAKQKNMDVAAIAEATGMAVDVIQGIMDGTTEPDADQEKTLADLLGVTPEKKKKAPPKEAPEMGEMQAQIAELRHQLRGSSAAIAALQAENKRLADEKEQNRVESFVEDLIRDRKVLPANRTSVIELAMALPNEREIEFSEGGKATPRTKYLATLAAQQPLYSNSALPTGPKDAPYGYGAQITDFTAADGYVVDADSAEIHRRAVAYCKDNNLDFRDADEYTRAVIAVS